MSELADLADDLDRAAEKVLEESRKVIARGALNIKRDAAARVSGLAHAPYYPRAISYDTAVRGDTVHAEIGPDKGRPQGPLGNLLEYGSMHNAPIPHLAPALEVEAPRTADWLEQVAGDLLEGSGD